MRRLGREPATYEKNTELSNDCRVSAIGDELINLHMFTGGEL